MKVLSEEKLQKMADYIKEYIQNNNGASPKFYDILEYMDMSKSVGYRYLTRLGERGIVKYDGKRTLAVEGERYQKSNVARVPIIGAVICGSPDEQEQYIEGYVAIPEEWVDGECFLLRAYGDSMVGIGVDEGDLVLVKKASSAENGQVVVALTDEGNTLKRLFVENGRPRLHPENDKYEDIYPTELNIQGIALKVIKDIR